MLVKDFRRLVLILGPVVVLSILSIGLWQAKSEYLLGQYNQLRGKPSSPPPEPAKPEQKNNLGSIERPNPLPPPSKWKEIFSLTTPNKTFFEIRFGDVPVFNPNILPHPTEDDTWIIMGQKWVSHEDIALGLIAYEMGCKARFTVNGEELKCIEDPEPLPIKPTTGGLCEGRWEVLNLNVGPHDARAFYGPNKPYTIYGSNSNLVCFGQWIQDFRELVPSAWKGISSEKEDTTFRHGTELRRPPPSHPIEKNYFVFWDNKNHMHAHYDIFPDRSFARLNEKDGAVGPNLALTTAKHDNKCLEKYLPFVSDLEFESIHQATNSLKLTLCNRSDRSCRLREEENTFIMTIVQHKSFYSFHSEYEPYVILFRQTAPYEVFAVSKKPLWISGRGRQEEKKRTDMLYVTSMGWKEKGMRYHGFLDDVLFLGFGVEDKRAGGIDVLAGDLVGSTDIIGLCEG
ncbi:hypothetical protein QBC38DRAFT_270093 [Podospora fimiseda]|uniref:Uncharacterized protein n=1 Tax=Podospora fimiseda TaxID=252190 RepID=A0AAN7BKC6_9PEZI|nr:hypothetical protein QBC38DRAFT_270093 [Podospora fimiseda]